jgi:sialate O-acetylesterase
MGWHFYGIPSEDTPWVKYEESSALGFPAIGAFFAKRLRRDIDIPLGIISCNWGATNAESWTDREKLLSKPMASFAVHEYDKKFASIDKEAYHERFMEFQKKLINHIATTEDIMKVARERGGAYALRHGFSTMIEEGPYYYKTPGNYRETMLARITPFAICGVLWYQGESNSGVNLPFDTRAWFREVMDTLIEDWREAFRAPSLPFYLVQLSTYPVISADATTWHDIRMVHEEMAEEDSIYTVVAADIGETDNIHPIDKKPIGERLALAALANEYGKDVPWRSPKIKNVSKERGKYILTFHDSEGLFAKGDAPEAFFVTMRDGRRVKVAANLEDERIVIDEVEGAETIGYCDQNYSLANVYNGYGLPLFPFRVNI